MINSLGPGRCGSNFESIILELIIQMSNLGIHMNTTETH